MLEAHLDARSIRSAWSISLQSVVWTLAAGTAAIGVGVLEGSAVLVALGAVGLVDAIGSIALCSHFWRARRGVGDDAGREALVHRLVVIGLFVAGLSAIALGALRVRAPGSGSPSAASVALAAASVVVLAYLAVSKSRVASRLGSQALRADGHLSALGASQSAVAVVGTGLGALPSVGWADRADPAAACVVGLVALAVAASHVRA